LGRGKKEGEGGSGKWEGGRGKGEGGRGKGEGGRGKGKGEDRRGREMREEVKEAEVEEGGGKRGEEEREVAIPQLFWSSLLHFLSRAAIVSLSLSFSFRASVRREISMSDSVAGVLIIPPDSADP
jgi:hypothetical protein